jgi:hypothetical protein
MMAARPVEMETMEAVTKGAAMTETTARAWEKMKAEWMEKAKRMSPTEKTILANRMMREMAAKVSEEREAKANRRM